MSDPQKPHELVQDDPNSVHETDLVFDCPACHKSLVVDHVAAGHQVPCPLCGKEIEVPHSHRVVTLAEAPETGKILAKSAWEQEMMGIESALGESRHQREEAGNFYKQHLSEVNRQKLRMERLDLRLKELEARKAVLLTEHPRPAPQP